MQNEYSTRGTLATAAGGVILPMLFLGGMAQAAVAHSAVRDENVVRLWSRHSRPTARTEVVYCSPLTAEVSSPPAVDSGLLAHVEMLDVMLLEQIRLMDADEEPEFDEEILAAARDAISVG